MNWGCKIAKEAEKQLRRLPRDRQEQIAQAIEEMASNPVIGDVRPIKSGKFKSAFRKRTGHYRIIFIIDIDKHAVEIAAILFRTDTTYK